MSRTRMGGVEAPTLAEPVPGMSGGEEVVLF